MMKMDKMTTSIWQNWPSQCQSPFSYIVKNVKTDNISTLNVLNIYVTIVTDEHQCTRYPIVQNVEASDFNHSGGYCYEPFFSPTCIYLPFFISVQDMHLPQGKHAFYLCLPYFHIVTYMCSPQGQHIPLLI